MFGVWWPMAVSDQRARMRGAVLDPLSASGDAETSYRTEDAAFA